MTKRRRRPAGSPQGRSPSPRPAARTADDALDELEYLTQEIATMTLRRDEVAIEARTRGATWRQLSISSGMTVEGARNRWLERTRS